MHLLGLNFARIHHEVGGKSSMSSVPSLLLYLVFTRTRQGETPSTCHSSDHHVHHTAQRVGNYKPTAIAVHPIGWSGIFQLGVLYLPKKIGVQNWTYNILKNSPSSCLAYNFGFLFYAKTSCHPGLRNGNCITNEDRSNMFAYAMYIPHSNDIRTFRKQDAVYDLIITYISVCIWLTNIFTTTCTLSIQIWKFVLYRILSAKNNMDVYLYGPTKSSERTIPYITTRSKRPNLI